MPLSPEPPPPPRVPESVTPWVRIEIFQVLDRLEGASAASARRDGAAVSTGHAASDHTANQGFATWLSDKYDHPPDQLNRAPTGTPAYRLTRQRVNPFSVYPFGDETPDTIGIRRGHVDIGCAAYAHYGYDTRRRTDKILALHPPLIVVGPRIRTQLYDF